MARKSLGICCTHLLSLAFLWCALPASANTMAAEGSVQEAATTALTETVGEQAGDVAPLADGVQAAQEAESVMTASVPEESANTRSRSETLIPSLPLAEGSTVLPAPATEPVKVVPLLETPAAAPIPDPLIAVPVPEKPMEADPQPAKAVAVDQKADQPERDPARLHPAPVVVKPLQPVGPALSPPVMPAWRGQHLYGAWGWYWRQQVYAVNQRVYWQYCAVCHGFLPAHSIDALVMRNVQQLGSPGWTAYPSPWTVGPWDARYQGRPGSGSGGE